MQLIGVKAKARLLKTARIKTEIMGDQFGWTALDRALKTELDAHRQTFVSKSIIPGLGNSDNPSQIITYDISHYLNIPFDCVILVNPYV